MQKHICLPVKIQHHTALSQWKKWNYGYTYYLVNEINFRPTASGLICINLKLAICLRKKNTSEPFRSSALNSSKALNLNG